jgi:hypothetical protein
MKTKIYNEIKTLENSHNDFQKKKGRIVRIFADNIKCFKCIDTKRTWKNRDNSTMTSLDGKGSYDIIGCYNCNNVGLICCSHTNNLMQNGFKIFNVNNDNWIERIEEIHNKASRDTHIMNNVDKWVSDINKLKVEPIKSVKIESVKIEPAKIESVKKEPVKIESVKKEPAKTESVKKEPAKTETMPLFEVCKRITQDYTEKSLNVNIEIGKIIDIVKNIVETYFGNIFSLIDLAKELKMSFSISNNQTITKDKLIKIKDGNYLGIKTCTRITKNTIKTGLFGRNKFAKEYTADIFILKPLNQKAIEKSLFIMGKIGEEMTDNILREF